MTIPEALITLISPVRWPLYAYGLSGGDAAAMAGLLDIAHPPEDTSAVWELYAKETEYAQTCDDSALFPFQCVCEKFSLDPFLRFAVTLSLAPELIPAYGAVCSKLGGLTPALLFRLFAACAEEAVEWRIHWLRCTRTLQLLFTETGIDAPLRLRPVVLAFLMGMLMPPEPHILHMPSGSLPEPLTDSDVPRQIAKQLLARPFGNLFLLTGAKGSGRKYRLLSFAKDQNCPVLTVRYDDIPDDSEKQNELEAFLLLGDCLLCVHELPDDGTLTKLTLLLRRARPPNVFIICDESTHIQQEGYSVVPLAVHAPGQAERLGILHFCLGDAVSSEALEAIARQYRFSTGQLLSACGMAREAAARVSPERIGADILYEVCRRQLAHQLDKLAVRVNTRFEWDDLILPPAQKKLLQHVRDRILHGGTVYGDWQLDSKASYGQGVRALFSGPPGTGKTMAAQIIARELHMELYKINLSSLVSKYIGETEKNLDNVFTEAAKSGGILFFDEADAIFGRRGEQKDSHDKYANLQTAFLLQRFEDYDGAVLLATNLVSNFDPAFTRRIHIRVSFPAPDKEQRRLIWETLIFRHGSLPLSDDIDIPFLADSFELTGSAIRNIVLTSAFMAATENSPIDMHLLTQALKMEFSKTDKILSDSELGEYR